MEPPPAMMPRTKSLAEKSCGIVIESCPHEGVAVMCVLATVVGCSAFTTLTVDERVEARDARETREGAY